MDRRFLTILGTLVVIFIAVFAITSRSSNKGGTPASTGTPTNHVTGLGSTGVKLVEYGDYQCSACETFEPAVSQVVDRYKDKIYFQFRNLPLYPLPHPFALTAARAAEAAALQDKFWQMHDMLYDSTNWQSWTRSSDPTALFNQYAQSLGLNVAQFKQDFTSGGVNDSIQADISAFLNTPYANHQENKKSTPSFFFDGEHISTEQLMDSNGPSVAKFAAIIDAKIAAKTKN